MRPSGRTGRAVFFTEPLAVGVRRRRDRCPAGSLIAGIVPDRVQQRLVEVAQLTIRRRVSAADANAWGAAILSVRLRIAVVPGIHRTIARLRSAIAVAAAAAVAAFPSVVVLGWFPTVCLLLHMKDLRV